MEKYLIQNEQDRIKAISYFGFENENRLSNLISVYPCILISNYSDDVEIGGHYQFEVVSLSDFVPFLKIGWHNYSLN